MLDGVQRPYLNLDAAASTSAFRVVADRVADFLPWYSSVHRGAGYKSQVSTAAYEDARRAILSFAGRTDGRDVAIICRNTTEAINHLAYRLRLRPSDVVVTTVVEHHANLLPWARVATRRFVECGTDGTFEPAAVEDALDAGPAPRLLAITGASNVSGWLPPLGPIIELAHARGVPVLVDGAQLAPHRPLPTDADFVAFSGHKLYAPFGAGALIGPRTAFEHGDPFLVGGGAVDLVDLDDVVWTGPPDREEAGSPNVLGAVALAAATRELRRIGWSPIAAHDAMLLGLRGDELEEFRIAARHHDRRSLPGAVRASAGISTTTTDVDRLLDAVQVVATTDPRVEYVSDPASGDYWPTGFARADAIVGPASG